jgi:coatomer subunit beta'
LEGALVEHTISDEQYGLAEDCLKRAKDMSGLMLLYTATGNASGMAELARDAAEAGRHNVAFMSSLLLQRPNDCIDLLKTANRLPEATLFARTYVPSRTPEVASQWRDALLSSGKVKLMEPVADPIANEDLFQTMKHVRC